MTAMFLILHVCLSYSPDGTCSESTLINDSRYPLPAHRCIIQLTRTHRAFLAHQAAGYRFATETWDHRPAVVLDAACSPMPVCEETCS